MILINGETKMVDLDEAVGRAVREQTVHDGSEILKIQYEPGKD